MRLVGRPDRFQPMSRGVLGVVSGMQAAMTDDGLKIHRSFGLVVDRLAKEFSALILSVPTLSGEPGAAFDYRLASANIEVIPQPYYHGMASSLRLLPGINRAYASVCGRVDHLLVRGMVPDAFGLYWHARRNGIHPCHWIVGDPIALLRSHRRGHAASQWLGLGYSYADRVAVRLGRALAGGALICNGEALAAAYRSPNTFVTVSSTLIESDLVMRGDTCDGPVVRVLLLSFMRPEKGVEYLVDAIARVVPTRHVELVLAGPFGRYIDYRRLIENRVSAQNLEHCIRIEDRYVEVGDDANALLGAADIFVLPSLSEGTPRILLEARAKGLPIVATGVGGIPSSVRDGYDGLLVPARDSAAIARALERLIDDRELRRRLIQNGYATARQHTLEAFSEQLLGVLLRAVGGRRDEADAMRTPSGGSAEGAADDG